MTASRFEAELGELCECALEDADGDVAVVAAVQLEVGVAGVVLAARSS